MNAIVKLAISVTLLISLLPASGQWEFHLIDSLDVYTGTVTAGDLENDGDVDVVVSGYNSHTLFLFKNYNFLWTKDTVDSNLAGALGTGIADFDGDGFPDILASSETGGLVLWYKNEGGNLKSWTRDTIDDDFKDALVVWAEDINGDGAIDAVVNSYSSGIINWYENNLPGGWKEHYIGSKIGYGSPVLADVNEDNKPDIVGGTKNHGVVLYLNNLPDTIWEEIIIDGNLRGAFEVGVGDIDNDGDMDIASTNYSNIEGSADVVWYENRGSGLNWTKYPVCSDLASARPLVLVDAFNDGFMDMVVGDIGKNEILLLKNEDGGQNWKKSIIDNKYMGPNAMYLNDMDLDGDLDLTLTTQANEHLVWYENHDQGTAYPISLELNQFSFQPQTDTLIISSEIDNPENHLINVFALVKGEQTNFQDTLYLYDDGIHGDIDSSDNFWSNFILSSEMPEDVYNLNLSTYDSAFNVLFSYYPSRFVSYGPVFFESYAFQDSGEMPTPGNKVRLALTLKNNGQTAVATKISAQLSSLNEHVYATTSKGYFEPIPAGASLTSESRLSVSIAKDCPVDTDIPIQVDIYSYDNLCWVDTLYIHVQENTVLVNNKKVDESLKIFPNPSDDVIHIEFQNTSGAVIELYDLYGKKLLGKSVQSNSESINVSKLSNGIYLVKVKEEKFTAIRKLMIQ